MTKFARMARPPQHENAASTVMAEITALPKARTKQSQVLDLLSRNEGALLSEIVAATGWLPHTARAALTGLKKKGHIITRGKRDVVTCYFIASVAA